MNQNYRDVKVELQTLFLFIKRYSKMYFVKISFTCTCTPLTPKQQILINK